MWNVTIWPDSVQGGGKTDLSFSLQDASGHEHFKWACAIDTADPETMIRAALAIYQEDKAGRRMWPDCTRDMLTVA